MMKSEDERQRDLELQRDALQGRKFSLAELIGREGGGFLKGESPVPKMVQLKAELCIFIKNHLHDSSGALQAVLQDLVDAEDEKISANKGNPLTALFLMIQEIIENDNFYYEFVKKVDLKYGQIYGERPHFQSPGQPAHPEDEYTHDSVKAQLNNFLKVIQTLSSSHDQS